MNNKLKKSAVPVIAMLSLLMFSNTVMASEVTGNLSTGLSSTVAVVQGVVIAPPVASPTAGPYTSAQSVTLTAPGSTSIRYTVDGTIPTCSTGTVYGGAVSVSSTQTIKAISCYAQNNVSTVASYLYTINISNGGGSGGGSGGGVIQPPVTIGKVDANNDGKVNVLDFVVLMINWGKAGTGNVGDFNNDSKVDILDFITLMINWTK